MEINYPYQNDDRMSAPFWAPATPDMMLRDTMIPPITTPYGTPMYWPPSTNYQGLPWPIATAIGYDGVSAALVLNSFPMGEFPTSVGSGLTGLRGSDLPQIVTPTAASDTVDTTTTGAPACSGLASWAGQHPVLALGAVVLVFAMIGKKAKK